MVMMHNGTARKLPLKIYMGKLAVQLKSYASLLLGINSMVTCAY